jgi:hypothetical protein
MNLEDKYNFHRKQTLFVLTNKVCASKIVAWTWSLLLCNVRTLMASAAQFSDGEGMRGATTESTSRYLSMAMASRRLMKHLDSFAVTGEMNEPTTLKLLRNLSSIMENDAKTGNSFAPAPGQSPFGRYEQARTVNEVAESFSPRDVRGKLERIAGGTLDSAERQASVRDINEFLYDLENRALHKYSESSNQREW